MGLQSPFGYVYNEQMMLETILNMVDRFCSYCHTNDDWGGNCHKCPVGNFLDEAKDYIRTCYIFNPFVYKDIKDIKKWDKIPKADREYRSVIIRLQDEIKNLHWCPLCYLQSDYDNFRWRLAELKYWHHKKFK